MASRESLIQARDNVAARLEEITREPKPDYNIDGKSVSWGKLFEAYTKQLESLNKAIASGEVFEERTVML